jgi:kojibiose phosphorylase
VSDEPGVDGAVDEWLVEESGFDLGRAGFHETVFTVGNGRIGTRGSLEEGPSGAAVGACVFSAAA